MRNRLPGTNPHPLVGRAIVPFLGYHDGDRVGLWLAASSASPAGVGAGDGVPVLRRRPVVGFVRYGWAKRGRGRIIGRRRQHGFASRLVSAGGAGAGGGGGSTVTSDASPGNEETGTGDSSSTPRAAAPGLTRRPPIPSRVGQCPNPATATPHPSSYTDAGDGTVQDNVTGLVWQSSVTASQAFSWDDADLCAGLTLGGRVWRLPTRIELLSIVDFTRTGPAPRRRGIPGNARRQVPLDIVAVGRFPEFLEAAARDRQLLRRSYEQCRGPYGWNTRAAYRRRRAGPCRGLSASRRRRSCRQPDRPYLGRRHLRNDDDTSGR